jgi:Protein of unknown function (DUF3987)
VLVTDFRADQVQPETPEQAAQVRNTWSDDDGPLGVVPFPTLDPAALQGTVGKIVNAVLPYTEAHPAPILAQFLARFGATIGNGAHVWADNRKHPARINPLIVGKTSDGAKGTSDQVVSALFAAVDQHRLSDVPLNRTSGLSSGEGLIEAVRDANGEDPEAKGFDEGVADKRLLVVETEFTSVLAVMERQGNILPRVIRDAWDGEPLRTLTRSPLCATNTHIIIVGHVTPGELRVKLKEAQLDGGTMNRFLPTASRRTKLCPDGGNIPEEILGEHASTMAEYIDHGCLVGRVQRTETANKLWRARYANLRKARPDGRVAQILARAVPQVLRLSLAYALADGCVEIDEQHLSAALGLWSYAEATAEWMFGSDIDTGELDALVTYIASAGKAGRTRTDISSDHFKRNRKASEIKAMLAQLVADGRVREKIDKSGPGRPVTRYFA